MPFIAPTRFARAPPDSRPHALLVVAGDLGRSPRMLYHAKALAGQGYPVDLIGDGGSTLPAAVRDCPNLTVQVLPASAATGGANPLYLPRAAWRAAALATRLSDLLLRRLGRGDLLLVQNPPGVPVLAVAWAVARARRARFVIDWHNTTAAMLALRLSLRHPLVRAADALERAVGRRADANFFVSRTMADALGSAGIRGTVFRDRPAEMFQPLPADERATRRRDLLRRLGLPENCGLAVMPTSWTADDDLDLLFDALGRWEAHLDRATARPVALVGTGRGPFRARFEARAAARAPSPIHLRTLWLEPEEYPRTLGCADVGLSLHRSASGLDLPMKAADLLGAGVPVLALDYGPCLHEQLRHGDNALLFAEAAEFARQLHAIFHGPADENPLAALAAGVARSRQTSWEEAWRDEAWPVLRSSGARSDVAAEGDDRGLVGRSATWGRP